jgi:hypothetical protein
MEAREEEITLIQEVREGGRGKIGKIGKIGIYKKR